MPDQTTTASGCWPTRSGDLGELARVPGQHHEATVPSVRLEGLAQVAVAVAGSDVDRAAEVEDPRVSGAHVTAAGDHARGNVVDARILPRRLARQPVGQGGDAGRGLLESVDAEPTLLDGRDDCVDHDSRAARSASYVSG